MRPNPNNMLKAEILDRMNFRCSTHRHNGFAHPVCYEREKGRKERRGFLDIEASNLKADFGIVLSWCIKPEGNKDIKHGLISKKDVQQGIYDKRIVGELIHELWNYDRIITHYGIRFDIPFIRTRAIRWRADKDFPKYKEIYHTDVWKISRSKLCISSNRQDAISRALKTPDIKTRIHPDIWLQVQMSQNDEALGWVLDHNKRDVRQLEANFKLLAPHTRLGTGSI